LRWCPTSRPDRSGARRCKVKKIAIFLPFDISTETPLKWIDDRKPFTGMIILEPWAKAIILDTLGINIS